MIFIINYVVSAQSRDKIFTTTSEPSTDSALALLTIWPTLVKEDKTTKVWLFSPKNVTVIHFFEMTWNLWSILSSFFTIQIATVVFFGMCALHPTILTLLSADNSDSIHEVCWEYYCSISLLPPPPPTPLSPILGSDRNVGPEVPGRNSHFSCGSFIPCRPGGVFTVGGVIIYGF